MLAQRNFFTLNKINSDFFTGISVIISGNVKFNVQIDLIFLLSRINAILPDGGPCVKSLTRAKNGKRFSRNALNIKYNCSPDFVTGVRFPANSKNCALFSNTSTSRLFAISNTRTCASFCSKRLAKTTNLAINGTLTDS
ncbi:hypothetical protein DERP_008793 [Dermatophagoides pteronyssinus]|uniref:Uncharacterized protein n=1 Tax=Dermatophagoides pteronyssinus TaxID=6956 RepID=A0ABQ8IWM4_DERPT|nr:hypothetical protein DERP_008793 [Dermatophagoides pteronyssinus]